MQVFVTGLVLKALAELPESALIEAMDLIHFRLECEEELALRAKFLLGNFLDELFQALVVAETGHVSISMAVQLIVLRAPFLAYGTKKVLAELHVGHVSSASAHGGGRCGGLKMRHAR